MTSEPGLVPELTVTDYEASRRFWCDLVGFSLRYERPEEGFGYLVLGNAHLMLDQIDRGRTWATGPLEFPLGRGINLEVQVDNLDGTLQRITEAGWPIFVEPEEKWYRAAVPSPGSRRLPAAPPAGNRREAHVEDACGLHAGCAQQRLRALFRPPGAEKPARSAGLQAVVEQVGSMLRVATLSGSSERSLR